MAQKVKQVCLIVLIGLFLVACCSCGSNRAALRSTNAPATISETETHYKAKKSYRFTLVVETPLDQRTRYYGERIAGVKLKVSSLSSLENINVALLIQERLVSELRSSGLFSKVTTNKEKPDDVMMKTEMIAFSAQKRCPLSGRIAGISALRVSLEPKGKILFYQRFEKAVTDADKEYTGGKPASAEQVMADSLREVIKEMIKQMEISIAAWPPDAVITPPAPM